MGDDAGDNAPGATWTVQPAIAGDRCKAIVACGHARGGTTLLSSSLYHLGIPLSLSQGEKRELTSRREHRFLSDALRTRDADAIRRKTDEFSAAYPVWAWKIGLPAYDLDIIEQNVRNAYFVMIFKEPSSIAARRTAVRNTRGQSDNPVTSLVEILAQYQYMAAFAMKTERPVLMVGYDKAMSNLDRYLAELAAFCSAPAYDLEHVKSEIANDQVRYLNRLSSMASKRAGSDQAEE